jgi:hypothetical protein
MEKSMRKWECDLTHMGVWCRLFWATRLSLHFRNVIIKVLAS